MTSEEVCERDTGWHECVMLAGMSVMKVASYPNLTIVACCANSGVRSPGYDTLMLADVNCSVVCGVWLVWATAYSCGLTVSLNMACSDAAYSVAVSTVSPTHLPQEMIQCIYVNMITLSPCQHIYQIRWTGSLLHCTLIREKY